MHLQKNLPLQLKEWDGGRGNSGTDGVVSTPSLKWTGRFFHPPRAEIPFSARLKISACTSLVPSYLLTVSCFFT